MGNGVSVGKGVSLGVGVILGVGVMLGVGVILGVKVIVGVNEGVAVGTGVLVGLGVRVGKIPISRAVLTIAPKQKHTTQNPKNNTTIQVRHVQFFTKPPTSLSVKMSRVGIEPTTN